MLNKWEVQTTIWDIENSIEKRRDYHNKKCQYLTYTDIYDLLHHSNTEGCGKLVPMKSENGKLKLAGMKTCRNKLCPLCNWRKSDDHFHKLQIITNECKKRYPEGNFVYLKLNGGTANDGKSLHTLIQKRLKQVNNIFKYKKMYHQYLGATKSLTISTDKNSNYIVNINLLVFVTLDYSLNSDDWNKYWKQASREKSLYVSNYQYISNKTGLNNYLKKLSLPVVNSDEYTKYDFDNNIRITDSLLTGINRINNYSYIKMLNDINNEAGFNKFDYYSHSNLFNKQFNDQDVMSINQQ